MLAHRRMVRDNGLSAVPCIRPGQSRKGSLAVQGEFPHGSGQRPIRCPLHTTAALPCRAEPRPASPRPAQPRLAAPRSVWMLPHPSRQRHALAVGYENCCLEFCCGLVSEPMLPPSRLSAPLLGPPSPRGLSSHHQSHGPLSSFPGGLLLRPPYRYGLHAAQTSFLRPGLSGYFPAGVPGVFAFPVRRESIIPNGNTTSSIKFTNGIT